MAAGDEGDVRRLARARRPRLRVPRPGARPQGQRGLVERGVDLGRHAVARRAAGSGASSPTAWRTAAAPTRTRRSWARSKAGTIVAITRGPVRADGFTWYEVTQPIREWSPVSFVERGVWIAAEVSTHDASSPTRAQQHDRRRRDPAASTSGRAAPRPRSARRPRPLAVRAFSPNGDGSEDAIRLRWTNARRLRLARRSASTAPTARSSASRSVPALARRRPGVGLERPVGGTRRAGRALRPAAGRARPAAGRSARRRRGRRRRPRSPRFGVTVDTAPPDGQGGLGDDQADLAQRRRQPRHDAGWR